MTDDAKRAPARELVGQCRDGEQRPGTESKDDGDDSSAEACCLAADMCVGAPVGGAFPGQWVPHPNPDLSLRFAGHVTGRDIAAAGRLERIAGGVALVAIEVRSGDDVVAVGASCSLLLA